MQWNMREPVDSEHLTTKCEARLYGNEVNLMVIGNINR